MKSERLTHNQQPIYVAEGDIAQFYQDDGAASGNYLKDMNRSGVRFIRDNSGDLLSQFNKRLMLVWSLQINPDEMAPECDSEDIYPRKYMSNFAAWYRHLTLDQPTRVFELTKVLKNEVLDGFRALRLKAVGEKRAHFWAEFGVNNNGIKSETVLELRFNELSDGQRSLIALYALITCAVDEDNTLCLDHPESYLALPEIQPWLLRLADATDEGRCQAIVATHHPEIINLLAAHSGYWLERQSGGPTRVKRIGNQDTSGLPLSELIARGWLHG